MDNEILFIRHGKTLVDKNVPIENWVLTDAGSEQAKELADNAKFQDADILISSKEDKAYLTIKPLADKISKEITEISELGEIARPDSEKLTLEEYEDAKKKIFEDFDFSIYGWETANHALNRFKEAVKKIDEQYNNKKIIICAHGTVMSLYFASMQDKLDELMSRWKGLEFGSCGIIKNGEVVKDII